MKVVLLLFWLFGLQHPVTGHLRHGPSEQNGARDSTTRQREEETPRRRLEIEDLRAGFQFAKARMLESIHKAYGEDYYSAIFEDDTILPSMTTTTNGTVPLTPTTSTIGRHAFMQASNADKSWERIKRKFMMRILKHQITGNLVPFVWATAGDQVAAGRGNFFDQQYTLVMDKAIRSAMLTVGIDLKTRPYGMGGLHSAPEVATCVKAIFGEDVDLLSWDFSSSDGHHTWRLEYFAHRVFRMDNRPAMLVMRADMSRKKVVQQLTDLGMGVLSDDLSYVGKRMQVFPNCNELDEDALAALPEHVRWFKCRNMIEAGKGCMGNKFTRNGTCDERPWRTSWHPGWKWHAFRGNLHALFLMEILEDALNELYQHKGADPEVLLGELKDKEDAEFAAFEASNKFMYGSYWETPFNGAVTAHQLADSPAYCHTARLPAQARYMGYVMDNPFPDDTTDFDRGIDLENALTFKAKAMLLTYDEARHKQECPATLKIDYKDFFVATGSQEDFQTMIVPNDIEMEVFGGHKPLGILLVCGADCELGCPRNSLDLKWAGRPTMATMTVNDEQVRRMVPYEDCYLLQRAGGDLHWTADENGQYTIAIKVAKKGNYMRIGTVIVW